MEEHTTIARDEGGKYPKKNIMRRRRLHFEFSVFSEDVVRKNATRVADAVTRTRYLDDYAREWNVEKRRDEFGTV